MNAEWQGYMYVKTKALASVYCLAAAPPLCGALANVAPVAGSRGPWVASLDLALELEAAATADSLTSASHTRSRNMCAAASI